MTIHKYKGYIIEPCEMSDWPDRQHGGRWTVRTYHPTGMVWMDSASPHFRSLRAAKEYIQVNIDRWGEREE